jgi:hypothetical protein
MLKGFYNNITIEMDGDDRTPVDADLIKKSSFFQAAFSLNRSRIVAPAAEEIRKDSSLGVLWRDIAPCNGAYTFELATVLPYFLPYFEDSPEYSVQIGNSELVFSSRMLQCYFSENEQLCKPLQYYLVHRLRLSSLVAQKSLVHVYPLPLKTFVTSRLVEQGTSAESIIQHNFNSWVLEFVSKLARFLDAIRAASPESGKHLLPQVSTPFLPIFWLYVAGADGKHGIEQFGRDAPSAAFRPLSRLDSDAVRRVKTFLNNTVPIPLQDSAIALARTYLHYGYLGQAIIQVSVACESALAKAYQTFLTSRGVSRSAYSDAKRDISFSQLLNLHLASARDLRFLQNRKDIIQRLNWTRKRRNEFVHEGVFDQPVTVGDVEEAINAAIVLIRFSK